jgi:hypothetical protein
MRVTAHVLPDGSITGLVVAPEGEVRGGLMPEPGVEVCEIVDHGLEDPGDVEQLVKLRHEYTVRVTPAIGELVRRNDSNPPPKSIRPVRGTDMDGFGD